MKKGGSKAARLGINILFIVSIHAPRARRDIEECGTGKVNGQD